MLSGKVLIARLRFGSGIAALLVVVAGCAVLIGWMLNIEVLKSVLPGLATMKAGTALGFVLFGVALWLLHAETSAASRRIAQGCAGLAGLIGFLTLCQYIFGWDLPFQEGSRQAPSTASNFVLLSLAFLLLDQETRRGLSPAQLFAGVAVVVTLPALYGYVFSITADPHPVSYTGMALHTTAAFLVLSAGILLARPEKGFTASLIGPGYAGAMMRRLLLAAVIVPPLLALLRLQGERAGMYGTEFGLALFASSNVTIFIVLVAWSGWTLEQMDAGRKAADEEIRKLNQELEQRVIERTAELTVANRELAAANGELESFSYSISHDLRAPLRAIEGFSRALQEDHSAKLEAEANRFLNIICKNTEQMGQLIDDLLAFSRLGRQQMGSGDIDMNRLAEEVLEEARGANPQRSLQFRLQALVPVRGDRSMLRQVMVNLTSNAVKFTGPRQEAVIEIGCRTEGEENVYYVKDNGVGFDMQYGNKLFGVFQRLHGAGEFEGTGVGLAIVRRVVERHGGRVWAEGKVGAGASFFFSLPATEETNEPERSGNPLS